MSAFANGKECRVVEDFAKTFGARESETFEVIVNHLAIFVISIDCRGIGTIFRSFHNPIFELNFSNNIIFGSFKHREDSITYRTFFAVTTIVAHAKTLSVEGR